MFLVQESTKGGTI